jgi:hypothetical protein
MGNEEMLLNPEIEKKVRGDIYSKKVQRLVLCSRDDIIIPVFPEVRIDALSQRDLMMWRYLS